MKLSKKGMITIPKEIRDELDLQTGDKFTVTKLGDIIVLQKSVDAKKSLQILSKYKKSIPTSNVSPKDIEEMIWGLLGQQLIAHEDKIINRTENKGVQIPGIKTIFKETVEQIQKTWESWEKKDFESFFLDLAALFDIWYAGLVVESVRKLCVLLDTNGESSLDPLVLFSVPIATALEMFQQKAADLVTSDILTALEIKHNVRVSQQELERILNGIDAYHQSLILSLRFAREISKLSRNTVGQREYLFEREELVKEIKKILSRPFKKRRILKKVEDKYIPPEPEIDGEENEIDSSELEESPATPELPSIPNPEDLGK